MTNTIDAIEKLIDQTWENLRVYRFPLHLALFMVLSSFEYYLASPLTTRLPYTRKLLSPIEITHLRQGLQDLVPMLFKLCKNMGFKYSHITDLRNLNTPYIYAAEAMNYCQKYDWIAYHLTAYRQGLCECQVKDRIITFKFPSQYVLAQSLADHLLHQYREWRSRDQESLSKVSIDSPSEKITESLKKAIKHKGVEEFLYRIPDDVFETYKTIVLASAPSPSIEESTTFSTYSVKQYYDFWITLSTLMISYLEACKIKYGNDDKRLMNSRVVIIHPNELAKIVASKSGLSDGLTRQIINEQLLDLVQKRPDVQIQPIIPMSSNLLFIAPHLIFTSNWEVCLLRNWAKISPGRYGEIVASKKHKLVDELSEAIQSMQIPVIKRKKLFNQKGDLVSDIDLAVFDKSIGYLIIAEIKWVIEPDSFQDTSHIHEELSKGIEQLLNCQTLVKENIKHFASNLFSGIDASYTEIKEITYVLISHGSLDCGFDTSKYNIPILDYLLCLDVLKSLEGLSIKDLFLRIMEMHNRAIKGIEQNTTLHRLKISGYLLETPGIKRDIPRKVLKSYPIKESCPCGSGKRYKDCCKIIESYGEDVNSLQD